MSSKIPCNKKKYTTYRETRRERETGSEEEPICKTQTNTDQIGVRGAVETTKTNDKGKKNTRAKNS